MKKALCPIAVTNTSPSNHLPDGDLRDNPDVYVIIQPQHFFNL